ncbi:MAG: hypothetical protein IKK05_07715 [Alistipes sp.]|nr:hypothetical protein [Alistipes sp.]
MAKKVVKETLRGGKIPHTQPLVVSKPKFDELLRKMSKPKGGKKKKNPSDEVENKPNRY